MDIVVTGSIAYDYLMRFPGRFRDHVLLDNLSHISVSFLVDDMARHWGGNAANISYNVALLGLHPRLMGTAGKDFGDYRAWLDSVGVDTRSVVVVEDVFTASFFANTDQENNQIASFYAGAMAHARNYSLADTVDVKPDYVVISPNDPVAMDRLAEECHRRAIAFMYDPSQQLPRLEPELLRRDIERCHSLILNEYEWGMLLKKTGLTFEDVLKTVKVVVRTLGKQGAEIFTDGRLYDIPIFPLPDERIADPTGAGDAFRSGILCGIAFGWPWDVAGRCGSLCAAYALEQIGTQSHRYTPQEFVARYRTAFDDQGVLDALMDQKATTN